MDFKLDNFTGPLDLLMQLIDRNQMDIMDIQISIIAGQFLECVKQMNQDLDSLSEFVSFAAELLDIKCKMLLPKEEQTEEKSEEDPRMELVRKLLEYKMYKMMAGQLSALSNNAAKYMYRAKGKINVDKDENIDYVSLLNGITKQDLLRIYQFTLRKEKQREDPVRASFGNIKKEEVDVDKQRNHIREYLNKYSATTFGKITEENKEKEETVVDFLLILEMAKEGDVEIEQGEVIGEIEIKKKE